MKMNLITRHYLPALSVALPAPLPAVSVANLLADFELLGDWEEKYQYLIDLGKKLPELPVHYRAPAHIVHGCQSQVWLVATGDAQKITFAAASDAVIVSGLLALLLLVYNGQSAAQILNTDINFITHIGLGEHLSPTRKNGLFAVLEVMQTIAAFVAMQEHAA